MGKKATGKTVLMGVDVGGTFTDIVYCEPGGAISTLKVATTRPDPSGGILRGLEIVAAQHPGLLGELGVFAHGTTVATNAVLERKGSKIGLLTTRGFRDVLEVARSFRPDMYDVFVKSAAPDFLVERAKRIGIPERVGPAGEVIEPLDEDAVRKAVEELVAQDIEAIAVSFLFSFLNPAHELAAREIISRVAPQVFVSLSHEVDPSFREYERTAITAFDAYVKPVLVRYLNRISSSLDQVGVPARLQIMQSRGGLSAAEIAMQRPVRLFLSGPAAGVVGARATGEVAGEPDLITFDVGGTSCDISLIRAGFPLVKPSSSIDGFTVRVPMVDVNAIGAGGGSIAWLDGVGGLRVGPQSAGADPGPACYRRSGALPTVTDASVVLGYINPEFFAGGTIRLEPSLAAQVIEEKVAAPLGISVEEAARAIHRVVIAQMSEGIRLVSVKRGIDPRDYTLVPLGGGGGIHATAIADELGLRKILVPCYPGVLAATGLLAAPVQHEASVSVQKGLDALTPASLQTYLDGLTERCRELMRIEGIGEDACDIAFFTDLCFVGQSHSIEVPIDSATLAGAADLSFLADLFVKYHEQIYGHGDPGAVRMVNLRAVVSSSAGISFDTLRYKPSANPARKGTRMVILPGSPEPVEAAIYERHALSHEDRVAGPAILEQDDTTTVIDLGWAARVIAGGNLLMERTA